MPLFTTELNELADRIGRSNLVDPPAYRRTDKREPDQRAGNGRRWHVTGPGPRLLPRTSVPPLTGILKSRRTLTLARRRLTWEP